MTDDRNSLEGDRAQMGERPQRASYPDRSATPRREMQRSNAEGFDSNKPTIIAILYLASFLTGITGLIGVVLAHVWQGDRNEEAWVASHYTYLIRTFWFSFLAGIVAMVLSVIFIGILLFPLIAIWFGARSVFSLMRAQRREPMPNPQTLGF
ncbi:DUF4870 family protein [Qipengyuania sphaerica]|uniref:DUF4870 family protein n=1 Tax=Qipengyuania sphaerica TaxID=2867243 RepID=UPI001C888E99|nr:hypothetical protein [Qipengyuania sphaerica]MBX7539448.1 hypothetical protein [Qipengyuania sphaerica]